jgi:hypothetical protein
MLIISRSLSMNSPNFKSRQSSAWRVRSFEASGRIPLVAPLIGALVLVGERAVSSRALECRASLHSISTRESALTERGNAWNRSSARGSRRARKVLGTTALRRRQRTTSRPLWRLPGLAGRRHQAGGCRRPTLVFGADHPVRGLRANQRASAFHRAFASVINRSTALPRQTLRIRRVACRSPSCR